MAEIHIKGVCTCMCVCVCACVYVPSQYKHRMTALTQVIIVWEAKTEEMLLLYEIQKKF